MKHSTTVTERRTLPDGYVVREGVLEFGQHPDDLRYGDILYVWGDITTGHLWWKKTRRGWVRIAHTRWDIAHLYETAWQHHYDHGGRA